MHSSVPKFIVPIYSISVHSNAPQLQEVYLHSPAQFIQVAVRDQHVTSFVRLWHAFSKSIVCENGVVEYVVHEYVREEWSESLA